MGRDSSFGNFRRDSTDSLRLGDHLEYSLSPILHKAPGDYPGGKEGDVLTVEFTVVGIPCLGLDGGPAFRHPETFSFPIATENQEETDRYWNAIVGNGGTESQCGWCKDRWGLSWQITCLRSNDGDKKDRHRRIEAAARLT